MTYQARSTNAELGSCILSWQFFLRLIALSASIIVVMASAMHALAQNTDPAQSVEKDDKRVARVLLSPTKRLSLQSELVAKVVEAPKRTGQNFKKGDLLVRFDCRQFEAELQIVQASANAASIELKSKKRLLKHRAVGKDEVLLAATNLERANAEEMLGKLKVAQCELRAPFDGAVVENHVRPFEYGPRDEPLMIILDTSALELEMVVPSTWLQWVQVGHQFSVEVDETGTAHNAIVSRISPEVDAVSQTVKLIGLFEKLPDNTLAGMSGIAHFSGGS